jgi:proprotein convertase subtilisin/kexin type 5
VGCAECSSASVCSKCTAGAGVNYYLNATACLSICPTGTLGITDGSGDLVCTVCTGPCATCSGTVDQCLSCASGNFLYYGEKICNSSCPQGFYNLTDKCKPCSIYCKTCSDSMSNCQSCLTLGGQPYYLSSNSCVPTCPDSTYGDTVSLWCLPCAPGCLTCFGPNLTRCYSCSSTGGVDYFLISGSNECSQTCPSTMYYHNSTLRCLACPLTCSTCSDDGLTCSSCSYSPALGLNLYLAPARDSCLVKCPPGYWPNMTVYECQVCNEGCSNCFGGTSSQCTACANSSGTVYYLGIASTICNTSCPSGQYVS